MTQREVSALELGHLYLAVFKRYRRQLDEAMSATGVSMSRATVLKELSEHGPMNQATLAARLGFAPRSVTDTVDALERDALAARSGDPNDRRARIVEITPAGAIALSRALAVKHTTMDQIFGGLDTAGRAQLAELLALMSARITALSGDCLVE